MKILVCGGRDFNDYTLLRDTLYEIVNSRNLNYPTDKYGNTLPNVTIVHGGAKGADDLADQWAVANWCPVEEYKADWDTHKKAAGPIRNAKMLKESKPDLVVAFPTKASKGTWHMVKIAKAAGVETIVIGD